MNDDAQAQRQAHDGEAEDAGPRPPSHQEAGGGDKSLLFDGRIKLDPEDEIVRQTLVTRGGKIVNQRVCEALGIEPPGAEPEESNQPPASTEPQADIYDVKRDT